MDGGIVAEHRAFAQGNVPAGLLFGAGVVVGIGHVHGDGDVGPDPGGGEVGAGSGGLLTGGGGGIDSHGNALFLGKLQCLHDDVGPHPVVHGPGGDAVIEKLAHIGVEGHRIPQGNSLQGVGLVHSSNVDGQVGGFQLLLLGQVPGVHHRAVEDAVFGMDTDLVAGIGGGIDAADVHHLQKALRRDGADHQADLVGVAGHQDLEGGVGIQDSGDGAHFVHRNGVGDGQHMVINLLFDFRFIAGDAVGSKQLH